MRKHTAIAVGAHELHGLCMQSGRPAWHARTAFAEIGSLDGAVKALLSAAPRAVLRAHATVVLSPQWVQTKRVDGLPPVRSARTAEQLLRESEQAFFLWKGRPSTIVVRLAPDRAPWAAAFDSEFLEAVLRSIRSAGLRIAQVAPAVGAIAAAFPDQRVHWKDDEQRFAIRGARDGLLELRRLHDDEAVVLPPTPECLRAIGADADEFVAAYAAAVTHRRLPLAWRPRADAGRTRQRERAVRVAASLALATAGAASALAPGLRAAHLAREYGLELQAFRSAQIDLSRTQSELRRVTDGLDRVGAFSADRGRITRTLGALSRAIPESTAILDIRLDSVEGTFTAISPSVADVLPAMLEVPDIGTPRIVGAVTRETMAGARLERAAFRFGRAHRAGSSLR